MSEINTDVEKIKAKLNAKEFEQHLDDCNYKFKDDVMRKVFMLKVNGRHFKIIHNCILYSE